MLVRGRKKDIDSSLDVRGQIFVWVMKRKEKEAYVRFKRVEIKVVILKAHLLSFPSVGLHCLFSEQYF